LRNFQRDVKYAASSLSAHWQPAAEMMDIEGKMEMGKVDNFTNEESKRLKLHMAFLDIWLLRRMSKQAMVCC
jgi:hypothetical protein